MTRVGWDNGEKKPCDTEPKALVPARIQQKTETRPSGQKDAVQNKFPSIRLECLEKNSGRREKQLINPNMPPGQRKIRIEQVTNCLSEFKRQEPREEFKKGTVAVHLYQHEENREG